MADDDISIDVLVESPRGSRIKYEWDSDRKAMRFDRKLYTATVFPADYGFIPDTESDDGEALDALVLTDDPLFPGCWITARPIGVFWIAYDDEDNGEQREAKILAVPLEDPNWKDIDDIDDLPEHRRDEISHFFDVYKELEPSRTPRPDGYEGRDRALAVIRECS
ncbi:MAG: inorganic diphosphatase [Acidimicrobiia bacterium]|nr:inorganic diphosphatase [Acidimicrobiia bacterium]